MALPITSIFNCSTLAICQFFKCDVCILSKYYGLNSYEPTREREREGGVDSC